VRFLDSQDTSCWEVPRRVCADPNPNVRREAMFRHDLGTWMC
jgi:hypothetical protein